MPYYSNREVPDNMLNGVFVVESVSTILRISLLCDQRSDEKRIAVGNIQLSEASKSSKCTTGNRSN